MSKESLQRRVRRVEPQSGAKEKSSGYSYHSKRDARADNNRHEMKSERTKSTESLFLNHIITIGLIIIVVFILLDLFQLNAKPSITILSNNTTTALMSSSSTYQAAAQKILGSSFLNQNKLTVNVSAVTNGLEKQFPEIYSASVTLSFSGHQAQIFIEPQAPAILLITGSGSYVLDSNGSVIGQENPVTQKAISQLNLASVNDPNLVVKKGQQVLSSQDVSFIEYVFEELAAQHISITSMTLPPATRELDVVPAGQKYFIKFNLQASVKEQVGSYLAVRQYLTQNKITPSQYIDVRVANRAYYK